MQVTFYRLIPVGHFLQSLRFAFSNKTSIVISRCSAPLAQLDRASVYGTEGQGFESLRARSQISHTHADPEPLRSIADGSQGFFVSQKAFCIVGPAAEQLYVADPDGKVETREAHMYWQRIVLAVAIIALSVTMFVPLPLWAAVALIIIALVAAIVVVVGLLRANG